MYYTEHFTVHCTVHFTVQFTVHSTLQYTLNKHHGLILPTPWKKISFLPKAFFKFTQFFTTNCTLYCILYCTFFFALYCKKYWTLYCRSFCRVKSGGQLFRKWYLYCLLFNVLNTLLYSALTCTFLYSTKLYTMYIMIYILQFTVR